MKKIIIFTLAILLPAIAYAGISRNHAEWTVPNGVTKINVKSFTKDGKRIMNYNFDVEPGQTFVLTTK